MPKYETTVHLILSWNYNVTSSTVKNENFKGVSKKSLKNNKVQYLFDVDRVA
jgi:hypothetical protein